MIEKLTKVSAIDKGLANLAKQYEENKKELIYLPVEKIPMDDEILKDAHQLMNAYLTSTGIQATVSLNKDFVIITEELQQKYPNTLGCYRPPYVYVSAGLRHTPRRYLGTIIHEKYHQSGFHYDALPLCTSSEDPHRVSNLGMQITTADAGGKATGDYFRVFNEAITEELTIRTLKMGLAEINSQPIYRPVLGPYEADEKIYSNERRILWAILEQVGRLKEMVPSQVFTLFVESYFNGTKDSLTLIKDAYGNDALDKLGNISMASLNQGPLNAFEGTGDPNIDYFLIPRTQDTSQRPKDQGNK